MSRASRLTLLAFLILSFPIGGVGAHESHADRMKPLDGRLAERPHDPAALRLRGELQFREGRLESALADLRLADSLEPGHPGTQLALAEVLLELARPQDALDCLAGIAPGGPAADRLRSLAESDLGRPEDARSSWARYLDARGSAPPGDWLRAADLALETGDPPGAVAALDRGAALLHHPWVLVERHALTATESGFPETALAGLDRVAASYDHTHRYWMLRGDALWAGGRAPEALADWTKALDRLRRLPAGRRSTELIRNDEMSLRQRLARETTQ